MTDKPKHQTSQGVAVAMRRGDGRFLLIRRSASVLRAPLMVCFPGGMVEPEESQAAAVVREMREELGVAVTPLRCVWEHDFADRGLRLFGWTAEIDSRSEVAPEPAEVAEVLWLTPDEAAAHPDSLPTVRNFVGAILGAQAS